MLCFTDVVLHPTVSGEGVCAGCLAGVPRQLAGRRMEAVMRELDYGKMGMRIRQLRKTKGWSQEELAKKCGISMSFLGHIERGSRIMSLETFVNICGALEADAGELLWGEVHPCGAVLDLWEPSAQKPKEMADQYSIYVKIMKSVAEIMSQA